LVEWAVSWFSGINGSTCSPNGKIWTNTYPWCSFVKRSKRKTTHFFYMKPRTPLPPLINLLSYVLGLTVKFSSRSLAFVGVLPFFENIIFKSIFSQDRSLWWVIIKLDEIWISRIIMEDWFLCIFLSKPFFLKVLVTISP